MSYPLQLRKVIEVLRRLPGVGLKSAERFAFQMLEWPDHQVHEMAAIIGALPEKIGACADCGCLNDGGACDFCDPARKDSGLLCVVSHPRDVYAIDSTGEYRGLFHVLGGLISPMEGIHPEKLSIKSLINRIKRDKIAEVVLALDSTLEGDATSLYLKEELSPLGAKVSRLALGLPMGSSLDYVDGGTLARAFTGRSLF